MTRNFIAPAAICIAVAFNVGTASAADFTIDHGMTSQTHAAPQLTEEQRDRFSSLTSRIETISSEAFEVDTESNEMEFAYKKSS